MNSDELIRWSTELSPLFHIYGDVLMSWTSLFYGISLHGDVQFRTNIEYHNNVLIVNTYI